MDPSNNKHALSEMKKSVHCSAFMSACSVRIFPSHESYKNQQPSMKPKAFLTRRFPENGISLLASHTDFTLFPHERLITKAELIEAVRDIEALVCMLTDPVDKDVIGAAGMLKVISNYAVGYNNIDLETARTRGIVVTNTPGVLTDATADVAFALMLACARRISESERWLRAHTFEGWAPMLFAGNDLKGKTLGIIGAGRIGQALAQRAKGAYCMSILYHNRRRDEQFEATYDASYCDLHTLLATSDFISVHVPLTDETRHMIGANEFACMKETAIIINTARGPVIDEAALIDALLSHRIFAAGLDVFEHEPQIPEQLKLLENVVILPHIGSASLATRARMAEMAAWNAIDVVQGREPKHRVV